MGMIMKNLNGFQTWLRNARLIFVCYVFCHVLSIEVNYIILLMCKSFEGMVQLLLILSRVDHWMGPIFRSLLLAMCTFVINATFINFSIIAIVFCKILFNLTFFGQLANSSFPSCLVDYPLPNQLADLHFLVKFVIILFMDFQFYFVTLGRYFVYMSIVYFVYYQSVQHFIFYFGSL